MGSTSRAHIQMLQALRQYVELPTSTKSFPIEAATLPTLRFGSGSELHASFVAFCALLVASYVLCLSAAKHGCMKFAFELNIHY